MLARKTECTNSGKGIRYRCRCIHKKVVEQKINYIHGNPIKPKWNLAAEPQDYKYSSAGFYYTGKDEFGFLENYLEVLNER